MSDRKSLHEGVLPLTIVINVNESYQLRHWAKQFGVSDSQIRAAVEHVGSSAEKVRQYLLTLHD